MLAYSKCSANVSEGTSYMEGEREEQVKEVTSGWEHRIIES